MSLFLGAPRTAGDASVAAHALDRDRTAKSRVLSPDDHHDLRQAHDALCSPRAVRPSIEDVAIDLLEHFKIHSGTGGAWSAAIEAARAWRAGHNADRPRGRHKRADRERLSSDHLSTSEAAHIADVARQTIGNAISSKKLPSTLVDGLRWILRSDLDRWLSSRSRRWA